MGQLQAKLPTDTWVNATWEEYLQAIGDPADEKAKGYYYNGRMRLEMPPFGNSHSRDRAQVIAGIALPSGAAMYQIQRFSCNLEIGQQF